MARLVFVLDKADRDQLVTALFDSDQRYEDHYVCNFCGGRSDRLGDGIKHHTSCAQAMLIAFLESGKEI